MQIQWQEILDIKPTPLTDVVRFVIIDSDNRVLLVQESDDINWKLPGGKVEPGESVDDALKRELMEELGLHFDQNNISNLVIAKIPNQTDTRYICRYIINHDINFLPNPEIDKIQFFELDKLPETKFSQHILSAHTLTA